MTRWMPGRWLVVAMLAVFLAAGCSTPPEPAGPAEKLEAEAAAVAPESEPEAEAPAPVTETVAPETPAPPPEPEAAPAPEPVAAPPEAPPPPAPAREWPRNVILFGWDGAQREHVNECLSKGELPTLRGFVDGGAYVEIDIEGTTDTKAGWSQILTGYYPEVTGVYGNGRYGPIPEGLSIGERLEKHFGPANVATLAVIGKKAHVDADPPKKTRIKQGEEEATDAKGKKLEGTIVEEDGVRYRVVPGKPHLNMSRNTDFFKNGLTQDEKVGTLAIEQLEKHKGERFFMFVHFAEVDHSGHRHGENSKEYTDALVSNDTWTGRIIDKVKGLGLGGDTAFYITADHGFNEGTTNHGMAPYVFLATNDKRVCRNGRRQDVAPTILEAFGLDLGALEPKLDGIPLTKPDDRPPAKIGPGRRRPAAGRAAGGRQKDAGGAKRTPGRRQKPAPAGQDEGN